MSLTYSSLEPCLSRCTSHSDQSLDAEAFRLYGTEEAWPVLHGKSFLGCISIAGLRISKDGQDLIDSRTGALVNAFGATRFDVAVHALRGDFDPPQSADVGMLSRAGMCWKPEML